MNDSLVVGAAQENFARSVVSVFLDCDRLRRFRRDVETVSLQGAQFVLQGVHVDVAGDKHHSSELAAEHRHATFFQVSAVADKNFGESGDDARAVLAHGCDQQVIGHLQMPLRIVNGGSLAGAQRVFKRILALDLAIALLSRRAKWHNTSNSRSRCGGREICALIATMVDVSEMQKVNRYFLVASLLMSLAGWQVVGGGACGAALAGAGESSGASRGDVSSNHTSSSDASKGDVSSNHSSSSDASRGDVSSNDSSSSGASTSSIASNDISISEFGAIYFRTTGREKDKRISGFPFQDFEKFETETKELMQHERHRYGNKLRGSAASLRTLAALYDCYARYDKLRAVYSQIGDDATMEAAHLNDSKATEFGIALGDIYLARGKYDLAEREYKKAISWLYTCGEPNNEAAPWEDKLNNLLKIIKSGHNLNFALKLASVYAAKNNFAKAEKLLDSIIKQFPEEAPTARVSTAYAGALEYQAILFEKQNKLDQAEKNYEQVLQMDEKAYGDEHPTVARGYVNLARIKIKQKNFSEAIGMLNKALGIESGAFDNNNDPIIAEDLRMLGYAHRQDNNVPLSRDAYDRALTIDRKVFGKKHWRVAQDLAGCGEREQARGIMVSLLQSTRENLGESDPHVQKFADEVKMLDTARGD